MHVRVEVTAHAAPLSKVVRARPEQVRRRVRLVVAQHLGCRLAQVQLEGSDVVLLRERRVGGEVVVEQVTVGRAVAL